MLSKVVPAVLEGLGDNTSTKKFPETSGRDADVLNECGPAAVLDGSSAKDDGTASAVLLDR